MTADSTPSRTRWYSSLSWWQRGFLFGAASLVVAFLVILLVPIQGDGNAPFFFYWPGGILLFILSGGHGAAMDPDWGILFSIIKIGTAFGYLLLGFLVGSLTRRLWLACAISLFLCGTPLVVNGAYAYLGHREEGKSTRKLWLAAQEKLRSDPTDVQAHYLIANFAQYEYHQPDLAVQEYNKIIELEKANPTVVTLCALISLAGLEQKRGRIADADQYYLRFQASRRTVPVRKISEPSLLCFVDEWGLVGFERSYLDTAKPTVATIGGLVVLAVEEKKLGDNADADRHYRRFQEAMKTIPAIDDATRNNFLEMEKTYLDLVGRPARDLQSPSSP